MATVMVTIKNKKAQPFVINIPGQPALHLLAREKRDITEEQFYAPEMKEHIAAGNIVVLRVN